MKIVSRTVGIGLGALVVGAVVATQAAAPVITNITMVGATPHFAVQSDLGITNQVQYCTNLSHTNWVVLTNMVVAQSPYWFVDVAAPPASQRFYRVAASISPPSGMALIPAGSFTMGDALDGESDAIPTVSVTVSGFYMDTNLVSYSQWQTVYAYATNQGYGFDNAGAGKAGNHPVYNVNWYDVVKWSNARSQQAGLTPVYYTDPGFTQVYTNGDTDAVYPNWSANGYRLPTEAEWEKAARGSFSGQRFPWGNTISWSQANYYGDPLSLDSKNGYAYDLAPAVDYDPAFCGGDNGDYPYTSPVGSFAPNGYGLYDMAGNVFEWCWDWYGTPYGGGTDPRGPALGAWRVFRGGNWYYYAGNCRAASRLSSSPTGSNYYEIGFRSVLSSGQ